MVYLKQDLNGTLEIISTSFPDSIIPCIKKNKRFINSAIILWSIMFLVALAGDSTSVNVWSDRDNWRHLILKCFFHFLGIILLFLWHADSMSKAKDTKNKKLCFNKSFTSRQTLATQIRFLNKYMDFSISWLLRDQNSGK